MSANYTPPHIPGAPTLPWLPHEIDAHPDAARIWATIRAAREETAETAFAADLAQIAADLGDATLGGRQEEYARICKIVENAIAAATEADNDAAAKALTALFEEIEQ